MFGMTCDFKLNANGVYCRQLFGPVKASGYILVYEKKCEALQCVQHSPKECFAELLELPGGRTGIVATANEILWGNWCQLCVVSQNHIESMIAA